MAKSGSLEMPKWFNAKEYGRLKKLDIQGWYEEFSRIAKELNSSIPNFYTPSRRMHFFDVDEQAQIGQVGGPYVTFKVSANMPDALISETFEVWFKELRKLIQTPARLRGPQNKRNSKFTTLHFDNWIRLGVVECGDFLVWRAKFTINSNAKCTDAKIAEWIGRNNSSKDLTTTKKALRQALEALDAMAAQVEFELINSAANRTLLSAELKNEISRQADLPTILFGWSDWAVAQCSIALL